MDGEKNGSEHLGEKKSMFYIDFVSQGWEEALSQTH